MFSLKDLWGATTTVLTESLQRLPTPAAQNRALSPGTRCVFCRHANPAIASLVAPDRFRAATCVHLRRGDKIMRTENVTSSETTEGEWKIMHDRRHGPADLPQICRRSAEWSTPLLHKKTSRDLHPEP